MNRKILTPAVQHYLLEHADANPSKIALAKSPFDGVSSPELATQIESRQKAKKKLNLWHNTSLIYYPKTLSIEQSSSEVTAKYKSSLAERGGNLIDLTGGFGVDSFYFSKKSKMVTHCEIDAELSEIVQHNARQLGAGNIQFHVGNGIDFVLQQEDSFYDTVFLDPSRRVNTKKVFKLSDCEPDIIKWQQAVLEKCIRIIIKTSPLLDISLSLTQLTNVKDVYILSVKNECKELLFVLEKDFVAEPQVHAVLLGRDSEMSFSFLESEERNTEPIIDAPKTFLYDPDSALLKAGVFKLIAKRFGLSKLNINTHLYTSDEAIDSFPGRVFKIQEVLDYKNLKKKGTTYSANVIVKNFPLTVDAVREKHKIGESKNNFMFFCKTNDDNLKVIIAERM